MLSQETVFNYLAESKESQLADLVVSV